MQAMISENVENSPEPSAIRHATPRRLAGLRSTSTAERQRQRQKIDDDSLRQAANSGRQRLAEDQRAARRRAHHVAVEDAEVALPDSGDAVEDRREKHTLGEDARRQEVEIATVARRQATHLGHHLAEQNKPDRRLDGACQDFARIMPQFAYLRIGHRMNLGAIIDDRLNGPSHDRWHSCASA